MGVSNGFYPTGLGDGTTFSTDFPARAGFCMFKRRFASPKSGLETSALTDALGLLARFIVMGESVTSHDTSIVVSTNA